MRAVNGKLIIQLEWPKRKHMHLVSNIQEVETKSLASLGGVRSVQPLPYTADSARTLNNVSLDWASYISKTSKPRWCTKRSHYHIWLIVPEQQCVTIDKLYI